MDNKRASSRRFNNPVQWQNKKEFFKIFGILSILLWLLFLSTMCYLYGSTWKFPSRVQAFHILYVDYDQGVIGKSVDQAYERLRGPSFLTLDKADTARFPSIEDVVDEVKKNKYWGAFLVHPDSSDRLSEAIQGGEAASKYGSSPALTYVWNEVRYPPITDEAIEGSFTGLVEATRQSYNALYASQAMQNLNSSSPQALQAFLDPVPFSSINLMPTLQGTKLFYNTVGMVMPILQQFFFLLILNGLSYELKIYKELSFQATLLLRTIASVAFTFGASLCTAGYIWAFREAWQVNGNQFVLSWMVYWLLMYVHLLILDCCTAFLPPPALPFVVLPYIIINITGTISPFEINPGFYRWAYALPAKEAYDVLTDIWSGGYVPSLYRALPVVFSWLVAASVVAVFGHRFRYRALLRKLREADETAEKRVSTSVSPTFTDVNINRHIEEDMDSEV
ncbi:LAMI_0F00166g1_1 [Lachancea mirantina]|uniref:LAMI_0F00166g1_1 n=1 Tax=Lachancea mirantina TaxID=1230905 RepID=A0A1G4JVA2_9SACH|nr:LAMI_0F00166g1_1 [Lachancea mirantina]